MNEEQTNYPGNAEEKMENVTESKNGKNWLLLISFVIFVFVGTFVLWQREGGDVSPTNNPPFMNSGDEKLESFASAEDFLAYVEEGSNSSDGGFFGSARTMELAAPEAMMDNAGLAITSQAKNEAAGAGRVSTTNVQVVGIDEPDIVKTDGKNIFTSLNTPVYRGVIEPMMIMEDEVSMSRKISPTRVEPNTSVINAFPPADLSEVSEIADQGELLVTDNVLMVFGYEEITGYDVSNPVEPSEKWSIEIGDNTQIQTSRLLDDELYVVTRTYLDYEQPCPLEPISPMNGLSIPCNRIYHPSSPTQVDSTYSVLKINPKDGSVTDSVSFVGSNSSTVVYMSPKSVYITYTTYGDYAEFMYEFFDSLGGDLVSGETKDRLKKLSSYELSSQAKMIEIQNILSSYYRGMSNDERRKIENEVQNRMEEFATEKMREMETTGIVKIDVSDLEIKANGSVPGHPLNQFSMDEYKDSLRIATTVGGRSLTGSESANDVYVLDSSMDVIGSVIDLGLDERIYSARFIGEMGYLVTFRETDPFYVLDLSNPKNPEVKGELKIPGFSSYLHPLTENIILGVGRDDSKVKLSMFDVSNPSDPTEVDKYMMDAYWTDVSNNHHAFLQDEKHKIFFIPANNEGYVFSYTDDSLSLTKVVSDINAKRALFLDDYLYIVGDSEIVVLNESDWERVNSLDF